MFCLDGAHLTDLGVVGERVVSFFTATRQFNLPDWKVEAELIALARACFL
jgi:hypothetical protein